jgi:hypothetical protein
MLMPTPSLLNKRAEMAAPATAWPVRPIAPFWRARGGHRNAGVLSTGPTNTNKPLLDPTGRRLTSSGSGASPCYTVTTNPCSYCPSAQETIYLRFSGTILCGSSLSGSCFPVQGTGGMTSFDGTYPVPYYVLADGVCEYYTNFFVDVISDCPGSPFQGQDCYLELVVLLYGPQTNYYAYITYEPAGAISQVFNGFAETSVVCSGGTDTVANSLTGTCAPGNPGGSGTLEAYFP